MHSVITSASFSPESNDPIFPVYTGEFHFLLIGRQNRRGLVAYADLIAAQ